MAKLGSTSAIAAAMDGRPPAVEVVDGGFMRCLQCCLPMSPLTEDVAARRARLLSSGGNWAAADTAVNTTRIKKPPPSPDPSFYSFAKKCGRYALSYVYSDAEYSASPRASSSSASTTDTELPAKKFSFKVVTHPSFELVESVVLDGKTGERLYGMDVQRGSVRHETLRFKLLQQTGPLKRTTTTAMRIMGMWQTVATEVLELGEYVASPTVVHEYQMPVANIPSSPFAAGRFKTEVVYEADGTVLRRESDIEFSIV